MFYAFIDDSGTAPEQKIASATALIIPKKRTDALESEWQTFINKYEISSFHTAECLAKNSHSEFANWEDLKVRSAFTRVRQIAKKYAVRAFSFAIKKADYESIVAPDLRSECGKYHYTWAVKNLAEYIDEWAAFAAPGHRIEYSFDWMDPRGAAKKEIEASMLEAEKVHPGRFAGRYSFRKRKDVVGLQCVDVIAWTCYRFALHQIEGSPLTTLQRESWEDLNRFREQDDWLLAVGQKPEQMREFVKLRVKVEKGANVKLVPFVRTSSS